LSYSAAREPLRRALGSRYAAIREAAAFELATKKDPTAFEALVGLLSSATDQKAQRRVIQALEALGDPRGATAMLDRVANDPAGTALADELIRAAGRFRALDSADRLLAIMDKDPKRQEAVFVALHMISGYDQEIVDLDDEQADDRWLREQHHRVDELLARMLDCLSAPGDAKLLGRLIPGARWARSKVVDPSLAALANHPADQTRRDVIEALAWRLRKRDGDSEPLRKTLGHRDPTTQFLAAEGLAQAGRPDGLNVLLASIDFATDLDLRRRAVLALGELADERAFETLLKLASEDGHALQESAAEAIGHMGRSPRADEVFKLLERQARGDSGVSLSALKGLHWLNNRAAWQLIRSRAADVSCPFREVAVELLGYNDDPATHDLLLKLLATLQPRGTRASPDDAMKSARRVFGSASLEPDYAVLQNENVVMLDEFDEILARVQDRGEPAKIFEILPKCPDDVREALRGCLLNRPDLPIAEAKVALESPDASTAALAAHVLGRAGNKAADAAPVVAATLARWRAAWEKKRSIYVSNIRDQLEGNDLVATLTPCVLSLVWAAGRLGVSRGVFEDVASSRPDDPEFRPIRREAVLALASEGATASSLKALESAAMVGDPETRAIAAHALARLDSRRAEALAERLLTDAVGFCRLALEGKVHVDPVLRAAAKQVHYQGVVLTALIDRGDVATLEVVLEDRTLPEATRLGALEGLAAMAREPAEEVLRRVGADAKQDEDLRKAAWRGLRRSRRAREKAGQARAKAEVKP
jgi:ParB family chromosome partitioning protein